MLLFLPRYGFGLESGWPGHKPYHSQEIPSAFHQCYVFFLRDATWGSQDLLRPSFSNWCASKSPGALVLGQVWSCRSRVGPRSCISNKLPGDAAVTSLQTNILRNRFRAVVFLLSPCLLPRSWTQVRKSQGDQLSWSDRDCPEHRVSWDIPQSWANLTTGHPSSPEPLWRALILLLSNSLPIWPLDFCFLTLKINVFPWGSSFLLHEMPSPWQTCLHWPWRQNCICTLCS